MGGIDLTRQYVISRPQQVFGWVLLIVSAVFVAVDLALMKVMISPLAIPAIGFALCIGFSNGSSDRVQLGEDGVRLIDSEEEFSYAAVQGVCFGHRPLLSETDPRSPVGIIANQRSLWLPVGDDARAVAGWVFKHIPTRGASTNAGSLEHFRTEQVEKYGDDRVFTYGPRTGTLKRPDYLVRVMSVVVVTAISWVIIGVGRSNVGDGSEDLWLSIGATTFLLTMLSLLVVILASTGHRHDQKKSKERGFLVIAPDGFALDAGVLRGKLRWDEVTEIKTRRGTHVLINLPGTSISLYDIFERPLAKIESVLWQFWRKPVSQPAIDNLPMADN